MRVFSFNELNIVVPCSTPSRAVFGASLGKNVQANRFGTFAPNRQNGFVALGNCFIKVSLPDQAGPGPLSPCGSETSEARSWGGSTPRSGGVADCVRATFSHKGRRKKRSRCARAGKLFERARSQPNQSGRLAGAHPRCPGSTGLEHHAAVGDRVMELLER